MVTTRFLPHENDLERPRGSINAVRSGISERYHRQARRAYWSYGLAVIGLTVAFRLVLLPVTIIQAGMLQAINILKPEEEKIRKKYKDDPGKASTGNNGSLPEAQGEPGQRRIVRLRYRCPSLVIRIQASAPMKSPRKAAFRALTSASPGWVMAIVAALTTYLSTKFSPTMGLCQQGQAQTSRPFSWWASCFTGWKFAAAVSLYIITNLLALSRSSWHHSPQIGPEGLRPSEKRWKRPGGR